MSGSRLQTEQVTLAYDDTTIVHELSLSIADGAITTIIGPNGCGKSTLLRSLARLLRPAGGSVVLDGQLIHRLPTREVARRLGLLHQQPELPAGITVEDLTRRGRYPHQSFLQPPSARDAEAVERALRFTDMLDLRFRPVDQLSGGQRQRAWMAMALAQETPILLLDEPTTFLDVAHQLEIVDLVRRLNAEDGRTVVMVLHDVNEAARASHHIIAMKDGRIVREGAPREMLTSELLVDLYGIDCDVYTNPASGQPFCVPRSAEPPPVPPARHRGPGFDVVDLSTGYESFVVSTGLTLELPAGAITAIVGPNACGKSTLLRTCGRLLPPKAGVVRLDGRDVRAGSHRALAQRIALLAQGPVPPGGFLVEDLVGAGRIPHQSVLRQWRAADEVAIAGALQRCGLTNLRFREVETLSGGQRQRAWVGLALAQETPVLLLDEPTTFLDISAQIDLLDLVRDLNREEGRTVVLILHDLSLAARYADLLIVMKDGAIHATGAPGDVLTQSVVRDVFEIDAHIMGDPRTGTPLVLPIRAITNDATMPPVPA